MNNAQLSIDFCYFSCTQIMKLLERIPVSSAGKMSFTPTLSQENKSGASKANDDGVKHVVGKVRYRAQGLDPAARYFRPSWRQRRQGILQRPFDAAQGILPTFKTKKKEKEKPLQMQCDKIHASWPRRDTAGSWPWYSPSRNDTQWRSTSASWPTRNCQEAASWLSYAPSREDTQWQSTSHHAW